LLSSLSGLVFVPRPRNRTINQSGVGGGKPDSGKAAPLALGSGRLATGRKGRAMADSGLVVGISFDLLPRRSTQAPTQRLPPSTSLQ
jgi:hypothetical protein